MSVNGRGWISLRFADARTGVAGDISGPPVGAPILGRAAPSVSVRLCLSVLRFTAVALLAPQVFAAPSPAEPVPEIAAKDAPRAGRPSHASADPIADAIAKAKHQAPRDALKTLLRVESLAPRRADLLARISIAWSDSVDVAQANHDTRAAENASRRALETAERALKADPKNAKAHLSMAIASGRMTDYVDNTTKVALSRRVRDEAERAIELDPKEDGAYYILGRWHYGVASVNPVLKFAARMVIGALPPASMKEAARNFEKAVALVPNDIEYHHQLALTFKALGRKDKAIQQWRAVLALPAVNWNDDQVKSEARAAVAR